MLLRPKKRICPSLSRVARSNIERQLPGLRKGSSPSNTSIRATAPSSRSDMGAGRLKSAELLRLRSRAPAHGAEELAVRVHHHHVRARAKARAVGVEAAVELGELRVA